MSDNFGVAACPCNAEIMITSLTLLILLLGSLLVFSAALVFIYRGRRGDEGALRRGTNLANWIVVAMCGIYLGFAFANPAHPDASVEIFFNGLLISLLILMRYHSVAQRLLLTSLLIGIHGLWDGLHLFSLPFANDLVPSWYALACAIFDLGYFGAASPICLQILRAGRVVPSQSPQET